MVKGLHCLVHANSIFDIFWVMRKPGTIFKKKQPQILSFYVPAIADLSEG